MCAYHFIICVDLCNCHHNRVTELFRHYMKLIFESAIFLDAIHSPTSAPKSPGPNNSPSCDSAVGMKYVFKGFECRQPQLTWCVRGSSGNHEREACAFLEEVVGSSSK